MEKLDITSKKPPLTIQFTFEEVKFFRDSVMEDIQWSSTRDQYKWKIFHDLLETHVEENK